MIIGIVEAAVDLFATEILELLARAFSSRQRVPLSVDTVGDGSVMSHPSFNHATTPDKLV